MGPFDDDSNTFCVTLGDGKGNRLHAKDYPVGAKVEFRMPFGGYVIHEVAQTKGGLKYWRELDSSFKPTRRPD